MSKVKVVYWSGSGNTEAMANAVADGIRQGGAEAEVVTFDSISPSDLSSDTSVALGCPAMGAEVLEESVVEPFISTFENQCAGKKLGLFGSYGWGDGQWMRDWVDRMKAAGATVVGNEGVIANSAPDDEAIDACKNLGLALV